MNNIDFALGRLAGASAQKLTVTHYFQALSIRYDGITRPLLRQNIVVLNKHNLLFFINLRFAIYPNRMFLFKCSR
jgi:hypothetical protein